MSTLRVDSADGRQVAVLTRADIVEALREYAVLYGDGFAQSAFSPSQAKRNGRPELVERYYKGRPDGRRWPSLNAIKSKFDGSWNDARAAAGFPPNSTGPASGRRPPGSADPILHIRERIVYLPTEKQKELTARVNRLEVRLENALLRARRAETVAREMRARRGLPAAKIERVPVVRTKVQTRVKTVTKTVKVKDERALERLRSRLADSEASRRASDDQLRSAMKDRYSAESEAADLRVERDALAAEAKAAASERDRLGDRLQAADGRVERLVGELEAAREQAMGVSEAALASEVVRHAEARVTAAEVRAARAEREMAEQGAAVTGELRKLTHAELEELRAVGPAGRAVLAAALAKLKRALVRGENGVLDVALTEVARAAVTWRDRLR